MEFLIRLKITTFFQHQFLPIVQIPQRKNPDGLVPAFVPYSIPLQINENIFTLQLSQFAHRRLWLQNAFQSFHCFSQSLLLFEFVTEIEREDQNVIVRLSFFTRELLMCILDRVQTKFIAELGIPFHPIPPCLFLLKCECVHQGGNKQSNIRDARKIKSPP